MRSEFGLGKGDWSLILSFKNEFSLFEKNNSYEIFLKKYKNRKIGNIK